MSRRKHPAHTAAHRTSRKIFTTIRATFNMNYARGWCDPDWQKAVALKTKLSSTPAHLALLDAAARAPGFADGGE
jgi:hypothetical protein